jgi:hypothetical protein
MSLIWHTGPRPVLEQRWDEVHWWLDEEDSSIFQWVPPDLFTPGWWIRVANPEHLRSVACDLS